MASNINQNGNFHTPLSPMRFQSSMGKEVRRRYKDGKNMVRLALAKVTKVNYKYNTVEVATIKSGDTTTHNPNDNGKFSARLPVQFGGTTPDGNVYGTNTLVTVGALVLIGFLDGNKNNPIVLNIYGAADNQSMLTRTTYTSADESDESLQQELWQLFSLYPSMTYKNIDGHGNQEITFPGKTFFYASADDAMVNDVYFDYNNLPNSTYANGDSIEPVSPEAPNMLYVHQAIYDKHRLTFFIKSDGTLRIGSRHLDGGGVTFMQMNTDGSFKIMQANDTIDPELESNSFSSFSIEEDGTIILSAKDHVLSIGENGILLDGSAGISGATLDLSGNQTITDLQGNVTKLQQATTTDGIMNVVTTSTGWTNLNNTANSKNKTYTTQPAPPYNKGDTWENNGTIYVCINPQPIGSSFAQTDWVLAGDVTANGTSKDTSSVGGTSSSTVLASISSANNAASSAQTTADGKTATYTNTPTVPYNIGDLWQKDNGYYTCITPRRAGDIFNALDWVLSADITSDNTAKDTSAVNGTSSGTVITNITNAQNTANSKAKTFTAQPTVPYNVGDVWNTSSSQIYVCMTAKASTGAFAQADWVLASDITANNTAKDTSAVNGTSSSTVITNITNAQNTANSKAKTYTIQPSPPYNEGDIWKNGATVYVCTASRASGSYTSTDWVIAGDVTANNTAKDTSAVNGTSSSTVITNITNAQNTANAKAQTFTSQPVVPYNAGDVWKNGAAVYVSTVTRTSGSFTSADWVLSGDVTSSNTSADTSNVNGTSSSTVITNITNAQNTASSANTLASSKAQGFIAQPTAPYNTGDVWNNNGTVYVCTTAKASGGTFAQSDWTLAGDITSNNTSADTSKVNGTSSSTVITNITNAQNTANSKAQGFVTQPVPPYKTGDVWNNNGTVYVCTTARASGTFQQTDWALAGDVTSNNTSKDTSAVGGTASSTVLTNITNAQNTASSASTSASNAQTSANNAQTLASAKTEMFVSQPVPPYNKGDLWNNNGTIYVANITRPSTATFLAADWDLAADITGNNTSADTSKVNGTSSSTVITNITTAQNTANSKSYSFTSTPVPPYNVGDLWNNSGKVYACTTSKLNTGTFAQSDWTLQGDVTSNNTAKDTAAVNGTTSSTVITNITNAQNTANSAQSTANNIQVGGTNLIVDSQHVTVSANSTGEGTSVLMTDESTPYYRVTPASGNTVSTFDGAIFDYMNANAIVGNQYTVSVDVRIPVAGNVSFYNNEGVQAVNTINQWTRISYTFTYSANYRVGGNNYSVASQYLDYRNWKLEVGNKATDWSLAPAEVQNNINAVQTNVNNLQVGGTNLLTGTKDMSGNTNNATKTTTMYNGLTVAQSVGPSSGYVDTFIEHSPNLEPGQYTVSFYAMASANCNITNYFYNPNNTTKAVSSTGQTTTGTDGDCDVSITTSWQRYWVTWTTTSSGVAQDVIIGRNANAGVTVSIAGVKLETGNKASDWSPSPTDQQNYSLQLKGTGFRYIRDWLNGSTANTGNHWVEIKAMSGTTDRALNQTVTASGGGVSTLPLSRLVDGDLTSNNYVEASPTNSGLEWMEVDLGAVYHDIDFLQIWHYYADGRTYHQTKTEVSVDGTTWIPVFDSSVQGEYPETSSGHVITLKGGVAPDVVSVNGTSASTVTSQAANGDAAHSQIQSQVGSGTIASTAYVASRGQNLVTNGLGQLGNNSNFSVTTFDGVNRPDGVTGSFKMTSTNTANLLSDEIIHVDYNKTYEISAQIKGDGTSGQSLFLGLAPFDVDGNGITPETVMYMSGTTTTLAQALNPGDTTVYLTSLAGWTDASNSYQRRLMFWNYKDSYGYTYPTETYTRNITGDNSWTNGTTPSALNTTANTITLNSAYSGPAIPAGTAVSQGSSGSSFLYTAAGDVATPTTWTTFSGTITGLSSGGTFGYNQFPPGTKGVKILGLLNYSSTVSCTTWVANVQFTEQFATVTDATNISNNTVNNLVIGGRNYILNTFNMNDLTNWQLDVGADIVATLNVVNDSVYNGVINLDVTTNSTVSGSDYIVFANTGITLPSGKFTVGNTYTLSFLVKNAFPMYVMFADMNGSNPVATRSSDIPVNANWERIVYSFTATATGNTPVLYFSTTDQTDTGNIYVTEVQLEDGPKASGYRPAPEDINNAIQTNSDSIYNITQGTFPTSMGSAIVSQVTSSTAYTSDLNSKANTSDVTGLASTEYVDNAQTAAQSYTDNQIAGIDFSPYVKNSSLTQSTNAITAQFTQSGGVNMLVNSVGYSSTDFWSVALDTNGSVQTTQEPALSQYGSNSGFSLNGGAISQTVTVTPNVPYTLGVIMSKGTSGDAYIELDDGQGTTNKMDFPDGTAYAWPTATQVLNSDGTYTTVITPSSINITPTSGQLTVTLYGAVPSVAGQPAVVFTCVMLNVGSQPFQWQMHMGEAYNANVTFNSNGITVSHTDDTGNLTGLTVMSYDKFAGYQDTNGDGTIDETTGSVDEIFRMDSDTFVMKSATLGPIKILPITSGGYSGLAFVKSS